MKTTLYLVRPAAAKAGMLSAAGQRQAELTRDFLAVRAIDACWCGPGAGARQTAAILAEPHGVEPRVHDALHAGMLDDMFVERAGTGLLVIVPRLVQRAYLADLLRLTAAQAARVALDRCAVSVIVQDRSRRRPIVTTLNAAFHLHGLFV